MRVLLDTNVWTYIGERKETEAFERLEDELGFDVVIPPSILLEALRIPVDEVLMPVVEALTGRRGTRTHPFPEARLEADELISEARRLRPQWLRRFPRSGSVGSLEAFWTRRLWQQAAQDPKRVARRLPKEMDRAGDVILDVQNANKQAFLNEGFHVEGGPPWFDLTGQPQSVTAGWTGDRIECWRFEGSIVWWKGLVVEPRRSKRIGGDTTYADWAGVTLDLDVVARDRTGFNRLWYYDASAAAMPRAWLRSTVHWVQLETKVGVGNPRDAQHAAYLLDADVFVTADRRFHRVLELLRPWCPVAFAEVRLVPGHGPIVDAIHRALTVT